MHYTYMFHTEYCIVISSDILLNVRDCFSYIDTAKKFTSRYSLAYIYYQSSVPSAVVSKVKELLSRIKKTSVNHFIQINIIIIVYIYIITSRLIRRWRRVPMMYTSESSTRYIKYLKNDKKFAAAIRYNAYFCYCHSGWSTWNVLLRCMWTKRKASTLSPLYI